MGKRILGDLDLPKDGDIIDQVADLADKEKVKEGVDIVKLFEEFGVKLEPKGENHLALCPWHDDTDPSLSVSRSKGLYQCFGCSESGDAFTLVRKMLGIGFREALDYLKGYKQGYISVVPTVKSKPSAKAKKTPSKPAQPPAKSAAKSAKNGSALLDVSLDRIADYYHKKLYASKKALSYLSKRGIDNPELMKRFKLGYADGSLLKVISGGQQAALKELGVIRETGKEAFTGCVVFPITDEDGRTVSFYARSVTGKTHLYLKGKHRSVFNRKASKAYDSIIITESIIDALSLIALGLQNVQAIYGTNGFTEEHLDLLKDDLVKEVVLAFDKDEAGKKATETIEEKLLDEGFIVKSILPPTCKDWNEELRNNVKLDEVKVLIEEAEEKKPEKKEPPIKVEKKNGKYLFTINGLNYRVLGVKSGFVSNLRVNIRAEKEEAVFLDNVDLYSSRSRNSFSNNLAARFDLETQRIEYDLFRIVEYLEEERDKTLSPTDTGPVELTPKEIEKGMELLTAPNLMERIIKDITRLGYVGEDSNKLLAYLAATSRKLADPISLLVVSQSASGKSMMGDIIKELLPPEDVVAIHSLSEQALNYLPEDGLIHKYLAMGEVEHSETVEHQIREMMSSQELSRGVVTKNEKTGELITKLIRKKVIVSTMMSTTGKGVNPENASRFFIINTDETKKQTKKIHKAQYKRYSHKRVKEKRTVIPPIIKQHMAAQRLLKHRVIINPYAEHLSFPDHLMRTRRDNERFVDLIAVVCFLRQYQKEVKEATDEEAGESYQFIECDLEDYRVVYKIMAGGVLSACLHELSQANRLLYDELRKMARKIAKEQSLGIDEVTFSQREIRERTGLGQSWVKQQIRHLVEFEYIERTKGGYNGGRNRYRLRADEPIEALNIKMIPTPEEIAARLESPGETG